jgi:arabinogalactan endo-1,4-beta-galactosidase
MKTKRTKKIRKAAIILCCLLTAATLFALKPPPTKYPHVHFDKILGADISFLPQLEEAGRKFYDNGVQKDAIQILKDHGFNYIRLRIFNNPAADSGYSKKGYCDLESTKKMALRVKAAGMGFLLDFHYSDNWADPGKQHKPAAWKNLDCQQLQDSLREFTKSTLLALKKQGTLPDMVQVGNEINHGMLWPDGGTKHLDTLVSFFRAGIKGVRDVDKSIKIVIHIACGGENGESRYFVDNMLKRNVKFDIIGESYYPRWHGIPDSLKRNINDLTTRYKQDVLVVEYSQDKQQVNDIAFSVPTNKMKGTFIWEPLNYGEAAFDRDGNANDFMKAYSDISKQYGISQ